MYSLPDEVIFNLQKIALADDDMVKGENAAIVYREIVRDILSKETSLIESQQKQVKICHNCKYCSYAHAFSYLLVCNNKKSEFSGQYIDYADTQTCNKFKKS